MSTIPFLTIKAKIRTRVTLIERNLERSLSKEKINKIKEHIQKKFDLKPEECSTGIEQPTLYTKDIFDFI